MVLFALHCWFFSVYPLDPCFVPSVLSIDLVDECAFMDAHAKQPQSSVRFSQFSEQKRLRQRITFHSDQCYWTCRRIFSRCSMDRIDALQTIYCSSHVTLFLSSSFTSRNLDFTSANGMRKSERCSFRAFFVSIRLSSITVNKQKEKFFVLCYSNHLFLLGTIIGYYVWNDLGKDISPLIFIDYQTDRKHQKLVIVESVVGWIGCCVSRREEMNKCSEDLTRDREPERMAFASCCRKRSPLPMLSLSSKSFRQKSLWESPGLDAVHCKDAVYLPEEVNSFDRHR